MRFDIVTIFPEFFTGPLDYGIIRRAREAGLIDVAIQDLRAFAHDRHRHGRHQREGPCRLRPGTDELRLPLLRNPQAVRRQQAAGHAAPVRHRPRGLRVCGDGDCRRRLVWRAVLRRRATIAEPFDLFLESRAIPFELLTEDGEPLFTLPGRRGKFLEQSGQPRLMVLAGFVSSRTRSAWTMALGFELLAVAVGGAGLSDGRWFPGSIAAALVLLQLVLPSGRAAFPVTPTTTPAPVRLKPPAPVVAARPAPPAAPQAFPPPGLLVSASVPPPPAFPPPPGFPPPPRF